MESPAYITKLDFPMIETERLLLRMFEDRDLDSAFRLFNDDDVQKYLSPENRRTRERMKITLQNFVGRWTERGFGLWCVGEKCGGEMLGYCGFQYFDETPEVEIMFAFFKDYWGRGFATEAANACLKFAFQELAPAKVSAVTHPENMASRYVLEKIGMVYEERMAHYGMDTVTYSISRCRFKPSEDIYKLTYKKFR